MKADLRVGALQLDVVSRRPEENLAGIRAALTEHDGPLPDLVCLPELCLTGYITQRDRDFGREFFELSHPVDGPHVAALADIAATFRIHLIAGLSEAHAQIPGVVYNSAVLLGPDGALIGVQRKIHIPGEEKHYFAPGSAIETFDTALGRIAIQICYDTYHPEMARVQALDGAEICCMVFNAPGYTTPAGLLAGIAQARAAENRQYVVLSNRSGVQGDVAFVGGSCIAAPDGELLAVGGPDRELVTADLRGSRLLEERAFQPTMVDRRPDLYASLSDPHRV